MVRKNSRAPAEPIDGEGNAQPFCTIGCFNLEGKLDFKLVFAVCLIEKSHVDAIRLTRDGGLPVKTQTEGLKTVASKN